MKMEILILFILAIFLASSLVYAEQTVKTIELPIGFIPQTQVDNDYIQTKTINSPDGITDIISLELIIKGDFQANTDVSARVRKTGNGNIFSCEPETWTTPNVNSPDYETVFDCSSLANNFNFLTKQIDLGLRTSKVAQNVKGNLKITYYNQPTKTINVKGTEYRYGEPAKSFLQLLDDSEQPIVNASCYITIYNPDTTVLVNRTLMTYVDEGLYQYDISAPSTVGVYMVSAFCDIPASSEITIWDDFECGDFDCGENWNSDWIISGNDAQAEVRTDNSPRDIYHLQVKEATNVTRNISTLYCDYNEEIYLTLWAKYEDSGANEVCYIQFYNTTDWITLKYFTDGIEDDETYRYYSYDICQYLDDSAINNTLLQIQKNDGGKKCWVDDINIYNTFYYNETEYQKVRGSGELHINDWFNNYTELISDEVWSWHNRTLTNFNFTVNANVNSTEIAENVWGWEGTISNNILSQFAQTIWNATYTISNNLLTQITDAIWTRTDRNLTSCDNCKSNLTAEEIWEYQTRNLTYYPEQQDLTNYTLITENIWSYWNRTLTSFDFVPDVNYDRIQEMIWNATDRNLTYYELNNLTVGDIWTYFNRTLTDCDNCKNNLTAQEVWEYAVRNLTYYPAQTDLTDYNKIQNMVWNATDRNLTHYEVTNINYTLIAETVWGWTGSIANNILSLFANAIWTNTDRNLTYYEITDVNASEIANEVWSFPDRNLTYYEISNITPEQIWDYHTRNLTYYEVTDAINYTQIVEDVWSYTNRTLTYYELSNLTAQEIWDYVNRTLTFYNTTTQVDLTNYTKIVEDVWNYINRTLTDCDCVNYSKVAEFVWTNDNRNLTYYPAQTDLTDYGKIQAMVWNATNRNLTYYEVADINYTLVAENVWNYNTRNLTFYETNNLTAYDIWNYVNRTLTDYNQTTQVDLTDYDKIWDGTWNYTIRNLTYYPSQSDLTDYNKIQSMVWNATERNLTYYEVTQINETEIAVEVWSYADRNLTYYEFNNLTAQEIWEYATRNLTYYETTDINYTLISDYVWQNLNRSLTSFDFDVVNETEVSNAVWNAINRTLTYYPDLVNETEIAQEVWTYVERNLTYYPSQSDLTDYDRIQGMVWNATDRNLTYYPAQVDLTDYDRIQDMVWNATVRTLTDFNFTVDINESAVADAVWSAVTRTLTDFNFTVNAEINETAIADAVWDATIRNLTYYPSASDLTNYEKIQGMVWNNTIRNLTYYPIQQDLTDYNLIQAIVWNATTRTLTEFNFTVDVNETLIAETVWGVVNRTLTDYNYTDLTDYDRIQEMTWNATVRTLTEFNYTVDAYVNSTEIADAVWTSVNRTLTDCENCKNNLTAYDIWNYSPRNLTYYEVADVSNLTVNINASEVANEVWNYQGTISPNILSQITDYFECVLNKLFYDEEGWGVDIPIC